MILNIEHLVTNSDAKSGNSARIRGGKVRPFGSILKEFVTSLHINKRKDSGPG